MSDVLAVAIRPPSLARQELLLWFTFLIIAFVSILSFLSMQRLIALSGQVEQTQNVLVETNRFLSDIKDVENGGRGYSLTGDARYLRTQWSGITNSRLTAARLRGLDESAILQRQLDKLFALAAKRIAYSRRLVAQLTPPDEKRRSIVLGTEVMDQVKREADGIIASQADAYHEERQRLESQVWLTSLALAVGVILCLAAIAWLFSQRGREVERRRQLEDELRGLNLDLEDRVQEHTADAKRARSLLTAVVENLPDMVLLKERSENGFKYALINAAGEQLIGRQRSEVIGRTEFDLFPADEAAMVAKSNKEVAESGQPRNFVDRKLTTTSGIRIVETRMVPIVAETYARTMILAIIRDVTDSRAREDQLRQLQRMDAVGRLTGGIAHDFNNLLAIIHGNSELLRLRLADGSEDADMAEDVIGAAARGAELVRRLLAFARMQHLEPESVDLNDRLSNVLGLLQRALGETLHVQVKTATGLWLADVDPTQVDDALVNLAINARDAMQSGGTLTIETQNVTLDEEYAGHHMEVAPGEYVMLAVSDTGFGMPPEVIARAFEPFFTTKEEGQGTGLGLSQVFGWIKQSGGHIKIYSEVGHGTTVKLYLPRALGDHAGKVVKTDVIAPRGDETILVVEDNPNVRKTVIRQLHDLGYRTVQADSGAQALQLVQDEIAFDLLLTDVIMPGGITGYQLAQTLRENRPDLKVLFTSGYTELAVAGDGPSRHDQLLSKPYRKQDLGIAVRSSLDSARGGQKVD